jgi:hypothetical protein
MVCKVFVPFSRPNFWVVLDSRPSPPLDLAGRSVKMSAVGLDPLLLASKNAEISGFLGG